MEHGSQQQPLRQDVERAGWVAGVSVAGAAHLAGLLLGMNGRALTAEDLQRLLGDPDFSAQVSATFGRFVRDRRDHATNAGDDRLSAGPGYDVR